MTTRHTISRADAMYSQGAYFPLFDPKPGLPIDVLNVVAFGAIALAAANNICTSQASSGGTNALSVNGALATAGVATLDVARNVVAAWTTTAVMTITGTDYYGQTQTEASASGTSHTGKKAFKTITAVTFSTGVTGATVGTGVKIGLPFRADANGVLLARQTDTADAPTVVAADTTSPATTTTGDVRGTVTFASAPDGTKTYAVLMKIADRTGGSDKKTGAFGVTPV